MQLFDSSTWGAYGLNGISVTSLYQDRRFVASLVLVFTVVLVGIFWIAAFRTYESPPTRGVEDVVVTLPGVIPSIAVGKLDNNESLISQFVTKAYTRTSLNSHLQCFTESGRWVYDPTPKQLPWNYVGHESAASCDMRHLRKDTGSVYRDKADEIAASGDWAKWSVREELKWVWQTSDSCPWQAFDRDEFCRMIGSDGHVMLVGDSLNHEILWSFMNALMGGNKSRYNSAHSMEKTEGPYEMCDDIFSSGEGFKLSFVRNDKLSLVTNISIDFGNNFYEFPWMNLLRERAIKILVLNRGAHYENDVKYTDALRKAFTILSLDFPDIFVIYRNTQPGHMACQNFTGPLSTPQVDFPPDWHWQDFPKQNALAKKITEDFGYVYMDIYTPLSLRPDGHVSEFDCLHYCLPGPLDLATEYMYNIMSLVRRQDVI